MKWQAAANHSAIPAIRVAEPEHVHLEFLEEPPAAGARITG